MVYEFEVAQAVMTLHYLLLVFLLSLGALQVSASIGGLRGLWLLPRKRWNVALAIALGVMGVAIFVLLPILTDGPWATGTVVDGTSEGRLWGRASLEDLSRARNLNDIHGGLNGGDYGAWFPLTALAAVGFSVVVGALRMRVNSESGPASGDDQECEGFGALENMDWFSAARISWRKLRLTVWRDLLLLLRETPGWTIPKLIARRWIDG